MGPAANASVDSMDVSMTSSGNPVKGGMLWWVISDAKRRPSDGDHTQHPSGTAERNTLRHLYSVNSIPRGKEWLNGKVRSPIN